MHQITTKICGLKQHTILSQFLWSPGMAESSGPGFLTRLELKCQQGPRTHFNAGPGMGLD